MKAAFASTSTHVPQDHADTSAFVTKLAAHVTFHKTNADIGNRQRGEQPGLLGILSPNGYLLALAVTEAILALRTLSSQGGGAVTVSADGGIQPAGRTVPAAYIASRISNYTGLSMTEATGVWDGIRAVMTDGDALPALHIEKVDPGTGSISLLTQEEHAYRQQQAPPAPRP